MDLLRGRLGTKSHLIVFDGAVGFHVVKGRGDDGTLRSLSSGQIVLERLNKEKAEHGSQYINLLGTMDIPILFQKVLTPFTWGSLVHDCCLATNALTGGTMQEHLAVRSNRLVYAQMIRECMQVRAAVLCRCALLCAPLTTTGAHCATTPCDCQAFSTAAQRGGWALDNSASCAVPLKWLEQLLCLPNALFFPVYWAFLQCTPCAGSPMQDDLQARRRTNVAWALGELTAVGKRYGVPMPACTRIQTLVEEAVGDGNGVPSLAPEALLKAIDAPFQSTQQLVHSLCLVAAAVFGLLLLAFVVDVLLPRELPLQ